MVGERRLALKILWDCDGGSGAIRVLRGCEGTRAGLLGEWGGYITERGSVRMKNGENDGGEDGKRDEDCEKGRESGVA